MVEKIALVVITTWLPISELRGGIPLGLSLGLDPLLTLLIVIPANSILFFPVLMFLNLFYNVFLSKLKIFNFYLNQVRQSGKPWVDKYGFLGLTFFVAIPLPLTGAYSGTILAWLLDMDWRRAFLAIGLGVTLAGIIVLLTALGIITLFKSFI